MDIVEHFRRQPAVLAELAAHEYVRRLFDAAADADVRALQADVADVVLAARVNAAAARGRSLSPRGVVAGLSTDHASAYIESGFSPCV